MPRYFFHVQDGDDYRDREGIELAGPEQARAQAVIAAGEALREGDSKFWNSGDWTMHVVDENGATVCRLRFSAE